MRNDKRNFPLRFQHVQDLTLRKMNSQTRHLLFSLQAWLNRIQLVEFCLFLVLQFYIYITGFNQGNVLQEMNVKIDKRH